MVKAWLKDKGKKEVIKMLYEVYTTKFDGWCMCYQQNMLYIIAKSEEEAKKIYKKNVKVGRKKVYVKESNKKGILKDIKYLLESEE